jgi:hypothetical protein
MHGKADGPGDAAGLAETASEQDKVRLLRRADKRVRAVCGALRSDKLRLMNWGEVNPHGLRALLRTSAEKSR